MQWVIDRQLLLEVGGFHLPAKWVMGYAGTPLCHEVIRAGRRVVRSTKRGEVDGKPVWLVHPMDATWSKMNHRAYYDKTGYNMFRRLAKLGKANYFEPRKVEP
jgi:hypothetical protein